MKRLFLSILAVGLVTGSILLPAIAEARRGRPGQIIIVPPPPDVTPINLPRGVSR